MLPGIGLKYLSAGMYTDRWGAVSVPFLSPRAVPSNERNLENYLKLVKISVLLSYNNTTSIPIKSRDKFRIRHTIVRVGSTPVQYYITFRVVAKKGTPLPVTFDQKG